MCYEELAKELLKSVLLRSQFEVKMAIPGILGKCFLIIYK